MFREDFVAYIRYSTVNTDFTCTSTRKRARKYDQVIILRIESVEERRNGEARASGSKKDPAIGMYRQLNESKGLHSLAS